jgi:MFS family permease
MFGRKIALVTGLTGFPAMSAVGGLAQSFGWLVASRGAQGAFAALRAPSVLAAVRMTFRDSPDGNRAFGVFGAIAASGGPVGLVLGVVWTASKQTLYGRIVQDTD